MKAVLLAGVLASAPLLASAATGNYAYFTDRDSGGGVSALRCRLRTLGR